jgi:hypothetical protein
MFLFLSSGSQVGVTVSLGIFGNIWREFGVTKTGVVLLVSSGQRPGLLLATLSTSRNNQDQIANLRLGNPTLEVSVLLLTIFPPVNYRLGTAQ